MASNGHCIRGVTVSGCTFSSCACKFASLNNAWQHGWIESISVVNNVFNSISVNKAGPGTGSVVVTPRENGFVGGCLVSGNVFNGLSNYSVYVAGGRIQRLKIANNQFNRMRPIFLDRIGSALEIQAWINDNHVNTISTGNSSFVLCEVADATTNYPIMWNNFLTDTNQVELRVNGSNVAEANMRRNIVFAPAASGATLTPRTRWT